MDYIEIQPGTWILVSNVEALEPRYATALPTGSPDGLIIIMQSGARFSSDLPIETIVARVVQRTGSTFTTFAQLLGQNT